MAARDSSPVLPNIGSKGVPLLDESIFPLLLLNTPGNRYFEIMKTIVYCHFCTTTSTGFCFAGDTKY